MAKIRIEICMISARGLARSSSLWKLQWFAVGWIDQANKYCSKIDSSGSMPTWRTKFSIVVDEDRVDPRGLVLTVEVRSRESIFLREKLHGTTSISLREFVEKFEAEGRRSSGVEEVGSFQLRGRKSGEPRGFVDVSVRVWEEGAGNDASFLNGDYSQSSSLPNSRRNRTSLYMEDGPTITYPETPWAEQQQQLSPKRPPPPSRHTSIQRRTRRSLPAPADNYSPMHQPATHPYASSHPEVPENDYTRRPTPPPPPPPSNTGFIPSFFPSSYAGAAPNIGGFGMGAGAGALAAGAVLFGDDFMYAGGFPDGGGLDVPHF